MKSRWHKKVYQEQELQVQQILVVEWERLAWGAILKYMCLFMQLWKGLVFFWPS